MIEDPKTELIEPGYVYTPTGKNARTRKQDQEEDVFVRHWFNAGFNQVNAAVAMGREGNDAKIFAGKMMRRESVRIKIKKHMERALESAQLDPQNVIREVAKIAFSNLWNFTRLADDGNRYIDLTSVTEEQMAAVSEIEISEYKEGRGEDARDVIKTKVKMHPKMAALDKLMLALRIYEPEGGAVINNYVNNDNRKQTLKLESATPEDAAKEYRKLMGQK